MERYRAKNVLLQSTGVYKTFTLNMNGNWINIKLMLILPLLICTSLLEQQQKNLLMFALCIVAWKWCMLQPVIHKWQDMAYPLFELHLIVVMISSSKCHLLPFEVSGRRVTKNWVNHLNPGDYNIYVSFLNGFCCRGGEEKWLWHNGFMVPWTLRSSYVWSHAD